MLYYMVIFTPNETFVGGLMGYVFTLVHGLRLESRAPSAGMLETPARDAIGNCILVSGL